MSRLLERRLGIMKVYGTAASEEARHSEVFSSINWVQMFWFLRNPLTELTLLKRDNAYGLMPTNNSFSTTLILQVEVTSKNLVYIYSTSWSINLSRQLLYKLKNNLSDSCSTSWSNTFHQSWALSVFFNFFNTKKWFYCIFFKLITYFCTSPI